jgi:NADPH-dependent 2,4-dienoyl-CoA reductase/sulfur reductase-like enzyme
MTPGSVVVVGAGLAGTRTAETPRARDFQGRIVVVGDEPVAPYERPALSKEYLSESWDDERLLLRPQGFWDAQEIELRLGRRIVAVDYTAHAVAASGDELAWDALVLGTGARPRRLPLAAPPGVYVLRTLVDAHALRAVLLPEARLVVVGGGLIGAEVASTARGLGVKVVMVEAGAAPLARFLGAEVGQLLADRYRAHGVELHTGVRAASFRAGSDGRLAGVLLTDGRELAANAALLAVGAEPARELLPSRPQRCVHACGDIVGPGTGRVRRATV